MVTTTGKLHNPFRFREISQNGTQLSAIYQDLPLNMRHLSTTKLAREDLQHTMKSRIKRASRARPSLFVAATTTKVLLVFTGYFLARMVTSAQPNEVGLAVRMQSAFIAVLSPEVIPLAALLRD
jgi:hypothetical protein